MVLVYSGDSHSPGPTDLIEGPLVAKNYIYTIYRLEVIRHLNGSVGVKATPDQKQQAFTKRVKGSDKRQLLVPSPSLLLRGDQIRPRHPS